MQKIKRAFKNSIWGSFMICALLSGACILLFSLIFALIAGSLDDPTGNLGIFSLCAMLISAAISGFINSRIKGEGGVGFATLVALSIVLIMLLINVIACGGKISLSAFMNYVCYLGVSALASYLGDKRAVKRRHRH